jgi:5-methyltetrahydrofolate--homocysteine methyltransferase
MATACGWLARPRALGDLCWALLDGAATEQAAILIGAGVDALLLETYRFVEAERVLHIVKRTVAASMSVLVSLWEWPDPSGPTAQRLLDAGAAVIGLNCQPGIAAALSFVRGLDRQVQCPLLVKPSVGVPAGPGEDPASFAAAVPELVARNVRLLGGCCGTSEAHVAALAAACSHDVRSALSCSLMPGETL